MQLTIPALMNRLDSEADAYLLLEELRWAGRTVCPHCGEDERCFYLRPANGVSRRTRTGSVSERRVWKCGDCRKQFSVLTGTIFHGTKIPVRTWLLVVFEMCASKNGVAAKEIERKYDLTNKSAWFMLHRIREAMKRDPLAGMLSGTVVADETYIGGAVKNKHKSVRAPRADAEPVRVAPGQRRGGPSEGKTIVLTLVEKATGEVRSQVIPDVTGATLSKAIAEQADMPNTVLHTDEHQGYKVLARQLGGHKTVNHAADEYVRYERKGYTVTTNQAENYFSQLKRSIDGTHHSVSATHLHRYLGEFDFRYSTRKLTDSARMTAMVERVGGRRLTYKPMTGRA